MISLSTETHRVYPGNSQSSNSTKSTRKNYLSTQKIHPELLDEQGKLVEEPLLVMRSVSVEDARQQLDSLYNSSPTKTEKED